MKQDDSLMLPVEIGDELELECVNIGSKGDGIFKKETFVIIAKNAVVGRFYKLQITHVARNVAFADIKN